MHTTIPIHQMTQWNLISFYLPTIVLFYCNHLKNVISWRLTEENKFNYILDHFEQKDDSIISLNTYIITFNP